MQNSPQNTPGKYMGYHVIATAIKACNIKQLQKSKVGCPQRFSTIKTGTNRGKCFEGKWKECDFSIPDCVGYSVHLPGMHFII